VVVYDSVGDTSDVVGPAAMLAQLLVDLDLAPEVGRLAGGFQAFKELQGAHEVMAHEVMTKGSRASAVGYSCEPRPDSAFSSKSQASRAVTPAARTSDDVLLLDRMHSLELSVSSRGPNGQRRRPNSASAKWKVSIDEPGEVLPAKVLPGLYLGNKEHAANRQTLRKIGITHILVGMSLTLSLSLSLFLSLSLSLSLTHTHTLTHSLTLSLSLSHTHTYIYTYIHTYTRTYIHTHNT